MKRKPESTQPSEKGNAVDSFQTTASGIFLERNGRARKVGAKYSNKKLCFVAIDQGFLAETLLKLSHRRDCYYVKLSAKSKDGMFLGRCFLMNEQVVGALWSRFKSHPKLMCSIQDDDFTSRFRSS